jgi:prepilin-type N-terminal cleavage/methylation domain-containing protein
MTGHHHRRTPDADTGLTLMEVVVAMSIMLVMMAGVTAGLVQIFKLTSVTGTKAVAQSQVRLVLLRLDRQVRYASGISTPHIDASSVQYVEYKFVEKGRSTCVQLRVTGGNLQQRSWTSGTFAPTSWATLASGVTSTWPFTRVDATDEVGHQRLKVVLSATAGTGTGTETKAGTVTYTALNTNRDSSADVCGEGT